MRIFAYAISMLLSLLGGPALGADLGVYGQCRKIDGLGFVDELCGPVIDGRWRFLHGEASHEKTAKNSHTGIPDKTWVTNGAVGLDRTFGPVRLGAGYQWYRQHLDSVDENAESPYVMIGHDSLKWDTTLRYTLGTEMLSYLRSTTRLHFRHVSARYELGHVSFDCCGQTGREAWWLGIGLGWRFAPQRGVRWVE